MNLAPVHLFHQVGKRFVVAGALQRRTRYIHGLAKVTEQVIQGVDHYLNRNILNSAHHDRFAAMLPKLIGHGVQLLGISQRLAAFRNSSDSSLLRDTPQQRNRHGAEIRRSDGHPYIGVAAGDREARLKLDVQRTIWPGLAGGPILPRKLYRREPCAQEVGIDAHNHARLVEVVVRNYRPPKRFLLGGA